MAQRHPSPTGIRPLARTIDVKALAADAGVFMTCVAIFGVFAISALTLERLGFAYVATGGGIFSKFHPSTFCAILAIALRCLASERPLRSAWQLLTSDAGVLLMLVAVVIAVGYAGGIAKTPVTGLVDTFVLPVLCFVLLRGLDPAIKSWLAMAIAAFFCVNAALAIIEFARGIHFIRFEVPPNVSNDPTRTDAEFDWRAQLDHDWRPTALLGHPLVNGLVVGCFVICLLARGSNWMPTMLRSPILLLQGVAMFTFGARTSLVLAGIGGAIVLVERWSHALGRGARLKPRDIALWLCLIAAAIVAVDVLVEYGIFDRTFERFADDSGSAKARVTMFELFKPFSWSDLAFLPDKDVLATWQRVEGLEFGIESAWVGLILTYGIIVTMLLAIGLAAFSWSVARATGPGAVVVLATFFITVSTSASMSGKTTDFALAVVLALLFLPPPAALMRKRRETGGQRASSPRRERGGSP